MILGIVGAKGSGKSTVARILTELVPGAQSIAFANPMKEFCRQVFDFTHEQLWGPSEEREKPDKRYPRGPCRSCNGTGYAEGHQFGSQPCGSCGRSGKSYLTPRHALQQLGTEWGRACYPEVWVEYGIRRAKYLLDPTAGRLDVDGAPLVIVTDCRFQNEVDAVRAADGKVLRVTRPGYGEGDAHASEAEAATLEVDHEIPNDTNLAGLERWIRFALPGFLGVPGLVQSDE